MSDTFVPNPLFIQVSNEGGLRFLERYTFDERANNYVKRRDASGAFCLRIVHQDGRGERSPPLHIVRCKTGPLLGDAEPIVRRKLGLPARVVAP
jgi:hypothetical protein